MKATLLALALCTACYSPTFRDCEVTCASSQVCPNDYVCKAGYCVSDLANSCIDAPPGAFGGPGCGDLLEPDGALGVALACGASCCGCEDLFVCENGGWELWGTCGDAGPEQSIPEP